MGQPSGERGEAHSIGKEERGPGIGRGLAAVLLEVQDAGSYSRKWVPKIEALVLRPL